VFGSFYSFTLEKMVVTLLIFSYFITKGLQDAIMASGKGFNWRNKYEHPFIDINTLHPIYRAYHELVGAKYKEKFFLSASLLVAFTDWWHFVGLLRHSIVFALGLYAFDLNLWLAGVSYVMGLIAFNFVYVLYRR